MFPSERNGLPNRSKVNYRVASLNITEHTHTHREGGDIGLLITLVPKVL